MCVCVCLFRGLCRVSKVSVGCALEFPGRIGSGLGLGLVFGCMSPVIDMIFKHVCQCVCPVDVCRCLSEKNQTASITAVTHKYEGLYRCVVRGHHGHVISNEVKLQAQGQHYYSL